MDRIQAMQVFARVVETGSFARAAEGLSMQKAKATRLVQWLEARLQTPLLNRTSRRVSLTTDGAAYYEHACRVLDDLAAIEAAMRRGRAMPSGRLRVALGATIGGLLLVPSLRTFCARYPDMQIELSAGNESVDLRRDGIDCAIRTGDVGDETLVVRHIADAPLVTVAAPEYLRDHGVPAQPSDLGDSHSLITTLSRRTGQPDPMWFERRDEIVEVAGRPRLAIVEDNVQLDAALVGFGVAQVARWAAEPHLRAGRLVQVLGGWSCKSMPLNVVYLPSQRQNARVRAFVAWAAEVFAHHPSLTPPELRCDDCDGSAGPTDAVDALKPCWRSDMPQSTLHESPDYPT